MTPPGQGAGGSGDRRVKPAALSAWVATFLLVAAATGTAAGGGSQGPTPCPPEEGGPGVLCGTVRAPEDHGAPDGRSISLRVRVLPATAPGPAPDPLFVLAGGPGEPATAMTDWLTRRDGAMAARDVVLFDQRGTGGSNPLDCPAPDEAAGLFGRVLPSNRTLDECLARLSRRADPSLYTTTQAAHDLETVRRALGYGRVNLRGGSYGTRLAMEYLRRYPASVRTVHLMGVVPPDFRAPLPYARGAQRALDRLLADCARSADCAAAFPDLRGDWRTLLERARGGPTKLDLDGGPVTFDGDDLAYSVRSMLYGPEALELPRRIHTAAATGDLGGFARAHLERSRRLWPVVAFGLHLSVFCSEDVPFIDAEAARRATSGTFLGGYLLEEYRRACSRWPRGAIPADFHDPVVSDRPVLIESGRRDPSTPAEIAAPMVSHLPRSLHVVHPWGGHVFTGTTDSSCTDRLVDAFLAEGSTEGLDTSCVEDEPPLPFRIEPDDGGGGP